MKISPHAFILGMVPAMLGYCLGSTGQLAQAALFDPWVYMTIMAVALMGLTLSAIINRAFWCRWMGVLLCCAGVGFALTGWRASAFVATALPTHLEGQNIAVVGVVANMPTYFEGGVRFRLEVVSAQRNGQPLQLPHKLDLAWYAGTWNSADEDDEPRQPLAHVQAGDRWQFTVRLKAPHGSINPEGFDYELWQWQQGVLANGYVRRGPKDPAPEAMGSSWGHPVERWRGQVRDLIFERVSDVKAAKIMAALVVGDQGAIDRADWDVFRATGVAHLMSISGLHITMFAWGAALVLGWMWRRSTRLCLFWSAPSAALVGGIALAGAYALFSGWGVPAQRTVLMLLTVGVLRLSGWRWPWPLVWLLAATVVMAADPWVVLQAGFWLSFVAVGVLFATDSGANYSSVAGVRGRLAALLQEQWVVTLALTPLSLLLFGQASLVGLLANLMAIPWVTLVITPFSMLGLLLHPLWDVSAWAIQMLGTVLQWLAHWPFSSVTVAQSPVWAGVAGVMGGVLLAMRLPWHWRVMSLPLLMPVLFWQAPRPPVGEFELLAADVGQGNAVVVQTASHALLYDAGPRYSTESDAGHRVLTPLLRALDVRLDTVILSHRDSDHTGGAQAVLMMQPQAQVLSSIEASHPLHTVYQVTRCVAGQRWRWDGVDFEIIHPQPQDYGTTGATGTARKTNPMSCVLRLSNGVQSALLAGDIEQAQETRLATHSSDLKSHVLLVPHHGGKTSSSAAFLDAVQPRIALIQVGYRNHYGHPAPSVVERYAQRHIKMVDSPHCGAMTWQSWHSDVVVCQRDVARHYWHHPVL